MYVLRATQAPSSASIQVSRSSTVLVNASFNGVMKSVEWYCQDTDNNGLLDSLCFGRLSGIN
jgi:hypothetical protein